MVIAKIATAIEAYSNDMSFPVFSYVTKQVGIETLLEFGFRP